MHDCTLHAARIEDPPCTTALCVPRDIEDPTLHENLPAPLLPNRQVPVSAVARLLMEEKGGTSAATTHAR